MSIIEPLILRARAEHACSDGASPDEIAAAERRLGFSLPDYVKRLLGAANGIRFWASDDRHHPCRLLSTSELEAVRALFRRDNAPAGVIALIEVQGDFVGIDLDPQSKSFSRLVDCSHETFPFELFGICDSVQRLLELILGSEGREWLWPAVRAYDVDFAA